MKKNSPGLLSGNRRSDAGYVGRQETHADYLQLLHLAFCLPERAQVAPHVGGD